MNKTSDNGQLKKLENYFAQNKNETRNLGKALKICKATKYILSEIEKLESKHKDIETQIILEQVKYPKLTIDQVIFFINRFKNGNINDIKYRELLLVRFIFTTTELLYFIIHKTVRKSLI